MTPLMRVEVKEGDLEGAVEEGEEVNSMFNCKIETL
jgi:hypothetical protein